MPAVKVTDWLMLPVPLIKATWLPLGALGLPAVKGLPLLLTPAIPENCQGMPLGSSWYVFAATTGCSKLPSAIEGTTGVVAGATVML